MKNYSRVIASSFAKVGTQTIGKSLVGLHCEHAQSIVRLGNMVKQPNQLLMCGIRDFVSRNLSYYFQTMCDNSFNDVQCSNNDFKGENCYIAPKAEILKKSTDELIEIFYYRDNHDTPLVWFKDFFKLIEFDYKNETFDKEIGYQKYTLKNGNDLLLYKLESLNSLIHSSPLFKGVVNDNIGKNKWYSAKYKDFTDKVVFTKEYLEYQLDNDIMRFFYTDEEIEGFKVKYTKHEFLGK